MSKGQRSTRAIAARYGLSAADVTARKLGTNMDTLRAARVLFVERKRSKRLAARLMDFWRPYRFR